MPCRVFADDIDDRRFGPPGIVQIGQAIGQAGSQVEKGRGGFIGHPGVSIGCAGGYPFEKGQDGPHAGYPV
jgi:hypothetical protein